MAINDERGRSTALTNIALVVVVILAALILFSRFVLGVEVFQCMSVENPDARVDCLQRIIADHNRLIF